MDTPTPGITMKEVMDVVAQMSERNQENLLAAITELKRPSEEEQRKLDEERARRIQRAQAAVKQSMNEEAQRENMRKSCPHGTFHLGTGAFTHQWRAQVHSPHGEKPYFVPRCTQCGTTIKGRILATPEQMQSGVNLDQYKGIDLDRLQRWADESVKVAS